MRRPKALAQIPGLNIRIFMCSVVCPDGCGMSMVEDETEVALEQKSVHSVYNIIASHFSETRYKVRCIVPTVC